MKEIDEEQVSQALKCDEEKQLQRDLALFKEEATRFCLTADCVLTAADVLGRMDRAVRPCDDFWKYSCGGWLREHHNELVEHESWGVVDEVEARIRRHIRQRLESGSARCAGEHMTTDCKMHQLYSRCMDTQTLDAIGARPLQDILDDFGGWSAHGTNGPQLFVTLYFTRLLYSGSQILPSSL